jgi:hypothetical protein
MKMFLNILTALPFCQKLFGGGQTPARHVQIVVAIAELNKQFAQSNQMLNLIAQSPSMLAAQFIKFSPLLIGHADVETEIFLCHSCKAARVKL